VVTDIADNTLKFFNSSSWVNLGSGSAGSSITMGAFGSDPNADGGTISGGILTLQPASGSLPGGVSNSYQYFSGSKRFDNLISPTLYNTNGASVNDRCVTIGTTLLSESLDGSAVVLSVVSNIGAGIDNQQKMLAVDKFATYFYDKSFISEEGTVFSHNGIFRTQNYSACLVSELTGASDVTTKVGTVVADAAVNVNAKLWSVRTGIGTSESEYGYYSKNVCSFTPALVAQMHVYAPSGPSITVQKDVGANINGGYNGSVLIQGANANVIRSSLGVSSGQVCNKIGTSVVDVSASIDAKLVSFRTELLEEGIEKAFVSCNGAAAFNVNSNGAAAFIALDDHDAVGLEAACFYGNAIGSESGSERAVLIGTAGLDYTVDPSVVLAAFCTNINNGSPTEKAWINARGSLRLNSGDLPEEDADAGSGAVTINACKGRITFAGNSLLTNVVVANDQCTPNSFISVTWENFDRPAYHAVQPDLGEFTITFSNGSFSGDGAALRFLIVQ
jgi:hypothetical protein